MGLYNGWHEVPPSGRMQILEGFTSYLLVNAVQLKHPVKLDPVRTFLYTK